MRAGDLVTALGIVVTIRAVVAARITSNPGGTVARSPRIAQWYGYTVCLVAVVTFLLSARGLVDDLFTLSNPLRSSSRYGTALTSFEAYEATQDMMPRRVAADSVAPPSEAELRRRYTALREDQIAQSRFDAMRGIVASLLMLLIAAGLFIWHWRWLRSLPVNDTGDA
jgi:hypothetical protein